MHIMEGVVAIVAIAGWVNLRGMKYRALGARRQAADPQHPSPREHELQREVVELRDRVKVLERIATDANSSNARHEKALADEIESLRDR